MAIHDNLNSKSNKMYYLGSGTTFDIKELLPNVDYTALTVDNFLRITPNSVSTAGSYSWTSFGGDKTASDVFTRGGITLNAMTYDATTGVLTVPAIQAYGQSKVNSTSLQSAQLGACSAVCSAYYIGGDIESV